MNQIYKFIKKHNIDKLILNFDSFTNESKSQKLNKGFDPKNSIKIDITSHDFLNSEGNKFKSTDDAAEWYIKKLK